MNADRSNQEWLADLRGEGPAQEAAIADLRDLLLRTSLFFFSRNLGDLAGLSRDEILQRAEDCAQDALIAVMNHLADFRGDSKFSTWVYKFAVNTSLMAARRERWKGIPLDELSESGEEALTEWVIKDRPEGVSPEQSAIQAEARTVVRHVIERELNAKQRQVLLLIVFNEVPMDEVVRHLGSNRNAVYKMLHDTRRKVKAALEARGLGIEETLSLFSTYR